MICFTEKWHEQVFFVAGVLEGIFQQILAEHEEEDPVREKALKFLVQKLKTLPDDALDKDCDDFVIADCKKVCTWGTQ